MVAERLTFAQYWHDPRFANKKPGAAATMPDNIYSPQGSELIQVKNEKHGPTNVITDLDGQYVLVLNPCWNLTYKSPETILPEEFGLRIIGQRRGHRVTTISAEQWQELKKWLDSAPRDRTQSAPRRRIC